LPRAKVLGFPFFPTAYSIPLQQSKFCLPSLCFPDREVESQRRGGDAKQLDSRASDAAQFAHPHPPNLRSKDYP
jgi:hypothetical protein